MVLQIEVDRLNVYIIITALEYAKDMNERLIDFEQENLDPVQGSYWQWRINILNDVINQISVQDKKGY